MLTLRGAVDARLLRYNPADNVPLGPREHRSLNYGVGGGVVGRLPVEVGQNPQIWGTTRIAITAYQPMIGKPSFQ